MKGAMAEPLVRTISTPKSSNTRMMGNSQNFLRVFMKPHRSPTKLIGSSLIRGFDVFGREKVVADPEDRGRVLLPFLHLHGVLADHAAKQGHGGHHSKKYHGEQNFGHHRAQDVREAKPYFCGRFEQRGLDHVQDQHDDTRGQKGTLAGQQRNQQAYEGQGHARVAGLGLGGGKPEGWTFLLRGHCCPLLSLLMTEYRPSIKPWRSEREFGGRNGELGSSRILEFSKPRWSFATEMGKRLGEAALGVEFVFYKDTSPRQGALSTRPYLLPHLFPFHPQGRRNLPERGHAGAHPLGFHLGVGRAGHAHAAGDFLLGQTQVFPPGADEAQALDDVQADNLVVNSNISLVLAVKVYLRGMPANRGKP